MTAFKIIYAVVNFVIIAIFVFVSPVWGVAPNNIKNKNIPDIMKVLQRRYSLSPATEGIVMNFGENAEIVIEDFNQVNIKEGVRNYVSSVSHQLLGQVAFEDLIDDYFITIPATEDRSAISFYHLVQAHKGVPVDATQVKIVVKHLNSPLGMKHKIIQASSVLMDPDALPASPVTLEMEMIKELAADMLGLTQDSPTHLVNETWRLRDEKWMQEVEIIFKDKPDIKLIYSGNAFYATDIRHYSVAPFGVNGRVEGRGVEFDFKKTGNNLDTFVLKDLEVMLGPLVEFTDESGFFRFAGVTSGQLQAQLKGRYAHVKSKAGPELMFSGYVSANNPTIITFNPKYNKEFNMAQVNGYYHTTKIHDWFKKLHPSWPAIDLSVLVSVNQDYSCAGSYVSDQLSFARSGMLRVSVEFYDCSNAATDTVIYHEYGHFLDDKAGKISEIDGGSLSEGWGDLVATYVSRQPTIGKDSDTHNLIVDRRANNEYWFPSSYDDWAHKEAQAWSAFGWNLRNKLKQKYGDEKGIRIAEDYMSSTLLANSRSIPEALYDLFLIDDDDANLYNGTPHDEKIKAAGENGLYPFVFKNVYPNRNALISSPEQNELILSEKSNLVTIHGTAESINPKYPLQSYDLYHCQGLYGKQCTRFGGGNSTVNNNYLGTWDVSNLSPGTYTLKLIVKTNSPVVEYQYAKPVHLDMTKLTIIEKVRTKGYSKIHDAYNNYVVYPHSGLLKMFDINNNSITIIPGGYADEYSKSEMSERFIAHFNGLDEMSLFNFQTQEWKSIGKSGANYHRPALNANGDKVVWTYMNEDNINVDIYLYDHATKTARAFIDHPAPQDNPDVYGDIVVFQDYRNGNWDIYAKSISHNLEFQVTNDNADQMDPSIDGDFIVYKDNRNGNWDLYLFYIPGWEEVRITDEPTDSINPKISGLKIVWEEIDRENIYEVHSREIMSYNILTNQKTNLSGKSYQTKDIFPVMSGDFAVWLSVLDGGAIGHPFIDEQYNLVGTLVP